MPALLPYALAAAGGALGWEWLTGAESEPETPYERVATNVGLLAVAAAAGVAVYWISKR